MTSKIIGRQISDEKFVFTELSEDDLQAVVGGSAVGQLTDDLANLSSEEFSKNPGAVILGTPVAYVGAALVDTVNFVKNLF